MCVFLNVSNFRAYNVEMHRHMPFTCDDMSHVKIILWRVTERPGSHDPSHVVAFIYVLSCALGNALGGSLVLCVGGAGRGAHLC